MRPTAVHECIGNKRHQVARNAAGKEHRRQTNGLNEAGGHQREVEKQLFLLRHARPIKGNKAGNQRTDQKNHHERRIERRRLLGR